MTEAQTAPATVHPLTAVIAELGLTIRAEFVPFSQSRNKAEKNPSLNWRVTLARAGRDILTTDYMAGSAHCPSYGKPVPQGWELSAKRWQPDVIAWECENGKQGRFHHWARGFRGGDTPILPKAEDVIASLVLDSSVLDFSTYESWASDFGYDPDSRKGEAIYRACLEIALKMRSGLGEAGLAKLAEAAQDY